MSDKLNYPRVLVLSLGFMVVSMVWAAYNSYMPIFLGYYTNSNTLIGFVMVWDNIANILLLPLIGAMSDNTRTRFGRRMPYIMIGMPIAGLLYALLPLQIHWDTVIPLLVLDLIFNIFMATYRSPVVALMPDIVPSQHRSKANGIINLMGGFGSLIMFFIGSQMYRMNQAYPFFFVGILSLIMPIILLFTVKEPEIARRKEPAEHKQSIFKALRFVLTDKDKSPLFVLLSIFMMIAGFGAVETFFTRYALNVMNVSEDVSSFSMGFYAISFLIFALPAGFIATKIGKRRTMMMGSLLLGLMLLAFATIRSFTIIQILMPVAGILNAAFSINSYPFVVSFTSSKGIGTYTGLYYFFSSLASIITPVLFGLIVDMTGYPSLFIASGICILLAFTFIALAKEERKETAVDATAKAAEL
ncbi:MFS transporter [Mahella sp.]|uniref:MFS transporter n=1 Tax=Mahella sp. TaxID=2798721 RepID=UPI0025C3DA7E|nr:MFS transporter [Mahella sp.]MBZ4666813.1 major facilitator superfamily 1 [Mahella sp.]